MKKAIVELIVFVFSYMDSCGLYYESVSTKNTSFSFLNYRPILYCKIKVHVPLSPDGQYLRPYQPFFDQYFFWIQTSRQIQNIDG